MKLTKTSFAAISALLLASVACAAPEPRRERKPEPPPARRDAPPPEPFERILDEDQRAELRDAFRENRERLREIEEQVRAGRRELHEAIVEGKMEDDAVKEKIEGIAKLEAERQVIRYKALAKIRPSLSDEQVERLKELHARRQAIGRDVPPGPGRRDFRPDPRERERHRDQIAPRPPGEFDERPRGARRDQRFERDEHRPPDARRPRYEDQAPRERPARPEFERRSPPGDFPEQQDAPPDRPSRGRPEPE